MKTKRQKERSSRRRASAVDRAERQKSGVKPYLDLPSGVKVFAFDKEGTKKIELVEYVVGKRNPNAKKGDLYYEYTFYTHGNVGPDGGSHICPTKTYNKPCPVCEHRAKLSRDPEDHKDEIKDLKPKQRQLFRVLDPKKIKDGIQIFEVSNWLFGKELDAAVRKAKKKYKRSVVDKFASPTEGMTVKVEVEEGSYNGRPTFGAKLIRLVPRDKQYDEDLVEEGPVLEELLRPTPYDKLKELFLQTKDEDDDEDEEDEDDDDSDIDDDEDDDDEDDNDDDDDDDDDEDDDDDDDEDDDDENDDDEDDDDEDDDDEEAEIGVGDVVSFTYKGKKRKGKVKRISKGLCHVKCKDRSDPYIQAPEDLKVVA